VNIQSVSNCFSSGGISNPKCVLPLTTLSAGTYSFTPFPGLYSSWTLWALGPRSLNSSVWSLSWGVIYGIRSENIELGSYISMRSDFFNSPTPWSAYNQSKSILTFNSSVELCFFVWDRYCGDNSGGISLRIEPVSLLLPTLQPKTIVLTSPFQGCNLGALLINSLEALALFPNCTNATGSIEIASSEITDFFLDVRIGFLLDPPIPYNDFFSLGALQSANDIRVCFPLSSLLQGPSASMTALPS
jgi:hypothetical protein